MSIGVVLFQLGGPDCLEAVEPFLYNLFCDPDIIDFPFARVARKPLARLISVHRAKHVAQHYARIGGKSPILENTARQANALEAELRNSLDALVVIAMRYWRPFTAQAILQLSEFAPDDLVLLPLYPQYSCTTTGSSLNEWTRQFHPDGWQPRVHTIEQFYDNPTYLKSLTENVNRSMDGFDNPADVDVIFSAHSVPIAVIESGDPYQQQVERTVDLVWRDGGWPGRRHLCYQSKVGASRWLEPSMRTILCRLAAEDRRHLLIVPISFVSDHVETVYEIDIEYREQAQKLGIDDYRMTPGLNDSPSFIHALAELVHRVLSK
jgi:ferrochelatase